MPSPHLLVIEGNAPATMAEHVAAGGTVASRNYADLLRDLMPGAMVDVCYPADPTAARVASSSDYLREVLADVPVLVIGAIETDEELSAGNQAGLWGSLLPAAWSFALALRARGLGTTWTTLHLQYEREVADILGIPPNVRQGVLLPVAYTKGTDFRPGPRVDLDSVVHFDRW